MLGLPCPSGATLSTGRGRRRLAGSRVCAAARGRLASARPLWLPQPIPERAGSGSAARHENERTRGFLVAPFRAQAPVIMATRVSGGQSLLEPPSIRGWQRSENRRRQIPTLGAASAQSSALVVV